MPEQLLCRGLEQPGHVVLLLLLARSLCLCAAAAAAAAAAALLARLVQHDDGHAAVAREVGSHTAHECLLQAALAR
jgi:hypothetical protein